MVTPKSSSPSSVMVHAQTVRTSVALPQRLLPGSMVGLHVPTPFATGLLTRTVIFSSARHALVAFLRTTPTSSPSPVSVMVPCAHARGLSACPPTQPVASASSARSKTPYFFFAQGPPLKMVPSPCQMKIGHLLNHPTFLLLSLLVALPYRSLMSLFLHGRRMDVHVVRVLQGTALSAPIIITRDVLVLNIPF